MKHSSFENSNGTVTFIRVIDCLFDMLNSRNILGKGFKQQLRLQSKQIWEEILLSTAKYLLDLKINIGSTQQHLITHGRKTFILGFVICIRTTIEMANEMFTNAVPPFKYLLTYKFSQDHLELLFSCIRAKGGWNNNPNCLQIKYSLRRMLMRNAVTAYKSANCQTFHNFSTTIIPIFHSQKHKAPLKRPATDETHQPDEIAHENLLFSHLNTSTTSEFLSNVPFYIGGFIVS